MREDFVRKAIQELPDEEKRLVMLRYADGLTNAEIALITGMQDEMVPRVIGALEAKIKSLEASTGK